MAFAQNFKEYLNLSGMTQADLSEEIGIPQSLISDYLLGKKNPSANNALKIASFFKVPLETLMGQNLTALDLITQSPRKKVFLNQGSLVELINISKTLEEKDLQTLIDLARRLKKK